MLIQLLNTHIILIVNLVDKVGKSKWKPYKVDVQASCCHSIWFLDADFSGEIPKEGELSCQLPAASCLPLSQDIRGKSS